MIYYPHQKKEALLIVAIMDHQAKDLIICHYMARTIQSHLTQSALKNKEVLINIWQSVQGLIVAYVFITIW